MIDGVITTQNITVSLFAVFVVKELIKMIPRYNGATKSIELLDGIKSEIKETRKEAKSSAENINKAQEKLVDVFILHDKQEAKDHTEIRTKLEEIRHVLNGRK